MTRLVFITEMVVSRLQKHVQAHWYTHIHTGSSDFIAACHLLSVNRNYLHMHTHIDGATLEAVCISEQYSADAFPSP